jgi:hypothetical protein
MATIVETVERDGETINVYESGAEYSVTRGHLIKAPPSALITKETARSMAQKRQDKVARKLRERIKLATEKVSDLPIRDSAEAIAEAGGILWDEIVLNPNAYHRDRLEAYTKLGQIAEGIPNASIRQDAEKSNPAAIAALNAGTAQLLAAVWSDVMQLQRQQPQIVDAETIPVQLREAENREKQGNASLDIIQIISNDRVDAPPPSPTDGANPPDQRAPLETRNDAEAGSGEQGPGSTQPAAEADASPAPPPTQETHT